MADLWEWATTRFPIRRMRVANDGTVTDTPVETTETQEETRQYGWGGRGERRREQREVNVMDIYNVALTEEQINHTYITRTTEDIVRTVEQEAGITTDQHTTATDTTIRGQGYYRYLRQLQEELDRMVDVPYTPLIAPTEGLHVGNYGLMPGTKEEKMVYHAVFDRFLDKKTNEDFTYILKRNKRKEERDIAGLNDTPYYLDNIAWTTTTDTRPFVLGHLHAHTATPTVEMINEQTQITTTNGVTFRVTEPLEYITLNTTMATDAHNHGVWGNETVTADTIAAGTITAARFTHEEDWTVRGWR